LAELVGAFFADVTGEKGSTATESAVLEVYIAATRFTEHVLGARGTLCESKS
jgi:hypothetical protein